MTLTNSFVRQHIEISYRKSMLPHLLPIHWYIHILLEMILTNSFVRQHIEISYRKSMLPHLLPIHWYIHILLEMTLTNSFVGQHMKDHTRNLRYLIYCPYTDIYIFITLKFLCRHSEVLYRTFFFVLYTRLVMIKFHWLTRYLRIKIYKFCKWYKFLYYLSYEYSNLP